MWQFENKKTTEMKASDKDEGFCKKSVSQRSLAAISMHSTGRQVGDDVAKLLSLSLKEDISNLLDEAGKYMRRTRAQRLDLSHIQHAVRMDDDLSMDIFFRQVVSGVCPRHLLEEKARVVGGALSTEPGPVPLVSGQESEPEIPLDPANSHSGWLKAEQVLLKPNKRYPLTKEQQSFFGLVTEACVGTSETRRQRALQTLSTDPSLEVLLPTLSAFIAEMTISHLAQENIAILFYLMRMVRALVANSRLNLLQYLHLILPAVLTCQLTKLSPDLEKQWALREYCGNIIAHILRRFDASEHIILPRVIGVYKRALTKEPLATVFGAVIGLGKMGSHVVRACILPEIPHLSKRIEPHLSPTATDGISTPSLDRQAAKYMRHRVIKMCTPVLKSIHKATDLPDQYALTYGFLGPSLCDSVVVSHATVEAMAEAKLEAEEASKMRQRHSAANRHSKLRLAGAVRAVSKAPIISNQTPSNRVRCSSDVPKSSCHNLLVNGQIVKIPPRKSCNRIVPYQKQAILAKPPGNVVAQSEQVPVPQFRNVAPPVPMRPFSPASKGILKPNKLSVLQPTNNGNVLTPHNNGRKHVSFLLK
ncbi:transcription initiation factor TFIID subunit 6 [Drosophila subpulchrella]|uniref:transcription initiation factor TFIID subunit 6 n=1 Tax=Drosophila subpulchrella TaxID=1486046 RepID=UPI0018A18554|nr:transcription initiation factor TFIID subunit 6 [Drosophila subpulchrella]